MPVSFDNPPLVELIAELRWAMREGPQSQQTGGALPVFTADATPNEEFFMRFYGAVQALGFSSIERVVPAGFPVLAYQPVYRFRPAPDKKNPVLFQVGAGIFSANAVPPYQTWDAFSGVVRNGVKALLQSRIEGEKNAPFVAASVRYIDAFGSRFTRGLDVSDFVQKVLGFGLKLPNALSKRIDANGRYKPQLQFQIPLNGGMNMRVSVGEGIVNKQSSIVMDMTVGASESVEASEEAVMKVLTAAQKPIHDSFVEMTEPIQDLMRGKPG